MGSKCWGPYVPEPVVLMDLVPADKDRGLEVRHRLDRRQSARVHAERWIMVCVYILPKQMGGFPR